MRVCLFEDAGAVNLEPIALTRPVFDLLCGQTSLAAKQCRAMAPCQLGVLVRPYLASLYRLEHPRIPVNDTAWLRSEPTVLINGRWLPPPGSVIDLSGPSVAMVGDQVAYAILGMDRLAYCSGRAIDDCLKLWKQTLPSQQAGGTMVNYLWDLIDHNPEQITADFRHRFGGRPLPPVGEVSVIGRTGDLLIDPTAEIEPHVVIDTRKGPVVIDSEAVVSAFTRIEGPCYVGPKSHVLGAKLRAGTSLGPCCRIGGEVECCIVQGFSNKYHDGFLGHSYVGQWVNIGAGVQTSDLRNDYGEVTVSVNGQRVPSGQTKVGSFLGDHTKIGLGSLLNTGTNVGVCCNLLPSGSLLPKYVPSFASWWNGKIADRADMPQLERIAHEVMRRRGWAFSEEHAAVLRSVYEMTGEERRRVLNPVEHPRIRRSA